MIKIVVSVTNDLVTDQRVHKICTTLTQMNFDVLLIGRKLKNSKDIKRNYKTLRFRLLFNRGVLFYIEYNFRLFLKLLFNKNDILLANDLDTLLANFFVSKLKRKKIVYDSHELFVETPEIANRPFIKKVWSTIEKLILPKLKNCYTVCDSIAEYYNNKYDLSFAVVRNLPLKVLQISKSNFPFDIENKKVILYQGAINKGRGLELMIDTMKYLDNIVFVLIGSGDIEDTLKKSVVSAKLSKKVYFLPRKIPEELINYTRLADLGISFEEDLWLSYHYALPNKLFDYIQAQIPVLVSELPEMKKIIETYKVGEIIADRNPKKLANQIEKILNSGKSQYKNQLSRASEVLTWDKESKKIVEIFKSID